MPVVAIVQARMGSTRLPGKVLADVAGKPMLERVVDRVRRAESIDQVLVATTDEADDDTIARFCDDRSIPCSRGSGKDVLDRYHRAAIRCGASVIVRITSDCPLIDPVVVDEVVGQLVRRGGDYASNTLVTSYPDGLDVEAFTIDALGRAWREADLAADREHVTPYIKRSNGFTRHSVVSPVDLGDQRWTVDEPADLEFINAIYVRLGSGQPFGTEEVLSLLAREPALLEINRGFVRDEGYYRSLLREPGVEEAAWKQAVDDIGAAGCAASQELNGVRYLDLSESLDPLPLGHLDLPSTDTTDGSGSIEGGATQRILTATPSAAAARFYPAPADAFRAAQAAARSVTGRDSIATVAREHGGDLMTSSERAAALIVDVAELGPKDGHWVADVRARASETGAILIYDERVTGFRIAIGGAQAAFGIAPDLAVFGTGIANGCSIGALAGPQMTVDAAPDPPAGEVTPEALLAARETLAQLDEHGGLEVMRSNGRKLRDGLTVFARELGWSGLVATQGFPTRWHPVFETDRDAEAFVAECRGRRVLVGRHVVSCAAHTGEQVELALRAFRDSVRALTGAASTPATRIDQSR